MLFSTFFDYLDCDVDPKFSSCTLKDNENVDRTGGIYLENGFLIWRWQLATGGYWTAAMISDKTFTLTCIENGNSHTSNPFPMLFKTKTDAVYFK